MRNKKRMLNAIHGTIFWKNKLGKYGRYIDNFFLINTAREEEISAFYRYLNEYFNEYMPRRCIIISDSQIANDYFCERYQGNPNFEFVNVTSTEKDFIIDAYFYKALTDKLMIVSIDNLFDRNLDRLIEKKGVSVTDLVVGGLLNIELQKKTDKKHEREDWSFRHRGEYEKSAFNYANGR